MLGKIRVKSYAAVSHRLVRRKCPRCSKREKAQLVDYGKGGVLLFFACGKVHDPKDKE